MNYCLSKKKEGMNRLLKDRGCLARSLKSDFLFGHLPLVGLRFWLGCVFFHEFSVFCVIVNKGCR